MHRVLFLTACCFLALAPLAAATSVDTPLLYSQVTGGEEYYAVPKGVTLTRLALEKGVRWQVLAKLNGLAKPYKLKPGMVLKINSSHIVPAEISSGIVINLPELKLYYFSQGVYQRRFALAIGRRSWPTPTGEYKIRNKAKNPTWTVPASIQEEMAEMGQEVLESVPPGPENPLGSYWLGTSAPGVGLHATNRPWSVGHSVSHGCMRMLPEDIADLFPLVQVGDPVKITYQPVKMAQTSQGRIYLEAHPDVYGHKQDNRALVENLARVHQLQDHLDWPKIQEVLKTKDGIAHEVSKIPRQASSGTPLPCRAGPRVSLVSPLHPGQVEIE